ncbi:YceI family protein [Bremerella cremea]|uniref:YceI family protein n=1 Tax=Bremerella cremea TaxID=1031537 RepID=A0A368KMA6_9BACT|nr:YceI family protein [Bremerella cremea]RCS40465.1 YceI family protein [Bremerella cremea]
MMRLFGLLLVTGIVCLGCKPPAGDVENSSKTETNTTTAPAATNDTLPPPSEAVKPAETVKPAEAEKAPEAPAAEPAPMKEMPAEEPAPPAETPKEEPKEEPKPEPKAEPMAEATSEVNPEEAAQPTPGDAVEGLLDNTPAKEEAQPAPETGAEMKQPEATETVAMEATGPVEVTLSPDNTLIQFVGTHVGDKPDPRTGNFGKFKGTAKANDGKLTSVTVAIETASLETEFDKLTNHLKNADFFDVRRHPEAKFTSTKIEYGDDGTAKITGDLTLLEKTKSITFPAKVTVGKDVKLNAEFVIDRLEFGMDYSPDKVHKDVTMTIKVGK